MGFPTESSLLRAIGRQRAIRKRRLEIRKEDAALEAEENEILEVGRASRPVRRKTLSGREAAGLRWGDVDLRHGRAHVWMPKVSRWKDVITPEWWVDEARGRSEGQEPDDRVCLTQSGRPWRHISEKWLRICQKAGVKRCPLYTLRHMAASLMLEAGADPAAVAAQLGHSSVATTASFYTHAVAGSQKRAAGVLPGLALPRQGA